MIYLRCFICLTLFLLSAARGSMRTDMSHRDSALSKALVWLGDEAFQAIFGKDVPRGGWEPAGGLYRASASAAPQDASSSMQDQLLQLDENPLARENRMKKIYVERAEAAAKAEEKAAAKKIEEDAKARLRSQMQAEAYHLNQEKRNAYLNLQAAKAEEKAAKAEEKAAAKKVDVGDAKQRLRSVVAERYAAAKKARKYVSLLGIGKALVAIGFAKGVLEETASRLLGR